MVLTPGETVLTLMTTLGCLMLNQNTTLLVMTCNYPILPPYKNLQALFFPEHFRMKFPEPLIRVGPGGSEVSHLPERQWRPGAPLGRLGTVENTSHTTSIAAIATPFGLYLQSLNQFLCDHTISSFESLSKCHSIALVSIGLPIAYGNNPQFIFGEWLRNPFFGNNLN